jgi:hypothetical protein
LREVLIVGGLVSSEVSTPTIVILIVAVAVPPYSSSIV